MERVAVAMAVVTEAEGAAAEKEAVATVVATVAEVRAADWVRSEEHTSELQSL